MSKACIFELVELAWLFMKFSRFFSTVLALLKSCLDNENTVPLTTQTTKKVIDMTDVILSKKKNIGELSFCVNFLENENKTTKKNDIQICIISTKIKNNPQRL